jgi:hypothetical protein
MEDGNPVRIIQQHLRRANVLLSQQQFDAALGEIDSALEIDPGSLPAQALRERVRNARPVRRGSASAGAHVSVSENASGTSPNVGPALGPQPRGEQAPDDQTAASARFVPSGVNEQSWVGFEQRIQERRFRALLESISTAVARNDGAAARLALEEARELRPHAPELVPVTDLVALLPAVTPPAAGDKFAWARAASAVGMLVIGVTLVVGLEWIRPSKAHSTPEQAVEPASAAAQEQAASPAASTTIDPAAVQPAVIPDSNDALEPDLEAPTSGVLALPQAMPTGGVQRISTYPAAVVTGPGPRYRAPASESRVAIEPTGEIPDDYVAPQPRRSFRPNVGSAGTVVPAGSAVQTAAAANTVRQPAPLTPLVAPPATVAVSAAAMADARHSVTQVLNQYARAYGALDASAARRVWPTVDERALARAFAGLESQKVSFDSCDIDVRGTSANASCRGRASYVGKVGSREPRVEPRTWQFDLKRDGDAWKIETAEARRATN